MTDGATMVNDHLLAMTERQAARILELEEAVRDCRREAQGYSRPMLPGEDCLGGYIIPPMTWAALSRLVPETEEERAAFPADDGEWLN